MTYCDYPAYQALGGAMPEQDFALWSVRASRKIDRLTLGRAARHADVLAGELACACAQMADAMRQRSQVLEASCGGALASANNDGYSESYAAGLADARQTAAFDARLRGILADCLGDDPYNLLYQGVCGC